MGAASAVRSERPLLLVLPKRTLAVLISKELVWTEFVWSAKDTGRRRLGV